MKRVMVFIGIGVGAGLMFALDPQLGNRRRAMARDKLAKAVHKTGHAVGVTSRDVANRATGLAASLQSRFFEDDAPDDVVEARVRARLGRVASHPHSIEVSARSGAIRLQGAALRSEMDDVVAAVYSVRGVTRVDNQLQPHEGPVSRERHNLLTAEWSPTMKLAVGLAGTALTSAAMIRRDKLGLLLGAVGLALVTRALGDGGIKRLSMHAEQQTESAKEEPAGGGTSIPVKFGPRPEGSLRPESTPPGRVH